MQASSSLNTTLSAGQRKRVSKGLPIRLSARQLNSGGSDHLPQAERQANRVPKARRAGKGVVQRFNKGGGLFDGLAARAIPLLSKAAPMVSRVAAPLATGAITALGSLGIDKLFGSGVRVPKGKVRHM